MIIDMRQCKISHLRELSGKGVFLGFLLACNANAPVLARLPSDRQLVSQSDLIVLGRWDGHFTRSRQGPMLSVEVQKVIKGTWNYELLTVLVPDAVVGNSGHIWLPDIAPFGLGRNIRESTMWFCKKYGNNYIITNSIVGVLPRLFYTYYRAISIENNEERYIRLVFLLEKARNIMLARRIIRYINGGKLPLFWKRVAYYEDGVTTVGSCVSQRISLFGRVYDRPVRSPIVSKALPRMIMDERHPARALLLGLIADIYPENLTEGLLRKCLNSKEADLRILAMVLVKTKKFNMHVDFDFPFVDGKNISPDLAWGIMDYLSDIPKEQQKDTFWIRLLCSFLDIHDFIDVMYRDEGLHLGIGNNTSETEDSIENWWGVPCVRAREYLHWIEGIWVPYASDIALRMIEKKGDPETRRFADMSREILQATIMKVEPGMKKVSIRFVNSNSFTVVMSRHPHRVCFGNHEQAKVIEVGVGEKDTRSGGRSLRIGPRDSLLLWFRFSCSIPDNVDEMTLFYLAPSNRAKGGVPFCGEIRAIWPPGRRPARD